MARMIFQTERLAVRHFDPDDGREFCEINSDPTVKKSIGDGLVNTLAQEQTDFDRVLLSYTDTSPLGKLAVILREKDTIIGACNLRLFGQTDDVEIGYRFKPAYWGQGYATELAIGLVNYCFIELGLSRVVATTNLDNYASMNVLRKAGFRLEREMIHHGLLLNYFTNTQSFSV